MAVFLTSDLHLHHKNILKYCDRPFSDVEEMDSAIIGNINDTVAADDELWILGDVAFGKDRPSLWRELLGSIDCRNVHLVFGNHDVRDVDAALDAGFSSAQDYAELPVSRHRIAVLSHYPMRSWNHMRHGAYMLHGHIHAGPSYNLDNREALHSCDSADLACSYRIYDVGVDANGYRPVALGDIVSFFGNGTRDS